MLQSLPPVALVSLALLTVSCDGCRPPPASGGTLTYIDGRDDVVVTGQVEVLAEVLKRWNTVLSSVITEPQMKQLRLDLALVFGFDPLDADKLRGAGFRVPGRWAAGFSAERGTAVVALPASDPERLAQTVVDHVVARTGAEVTDLAEGRSLFTTFGPDRVEQGAVLVRGSTVLWVIGPGAAKQIGALVPQAVSAVALDEGRGESLVRARIRPQALDVLVGRRLSPADAKLVRETLESVDVELDIDPRGLDVHSEAALTPAGLAKAKRLKADGTDASVRSVEVPDAIVIAHGQVDPRGAFDLLAPPGGPIRRELEAARSQGRLLFDLEASIVPALSGAFSLVVGAGDLSQLSFGALVGNPQGSLWSAMGLGRKSVELDPFEEVLQQAQGADSATVESRLVKGLTVRSVRSGGVLVAEAVTTDRAWFVSNEPAVMNRVLARLDATAEPLPPLGIEVDFVELRRVLGTFRAASLPLFVRAIWAQGLDALGLLEFARAEAEWSDRGLRGSGRLQFRDVAETP